MTHLPDPVTGRTQCSRFAISDLPRNRHYIGRHGTCPDCNRMVKVKARHVAAFNRWQQRLRTFFEVTGRT